MTPAKSAFGRRSALLIVGLSIYGCATDAVAPSSVAPPAPPSAPKTAAVAFGEQAAAIREMGETPDWGEVADRMERLVRDHPRYGIGWYNLGVALERLGEAERATDAYRRALAVDDDLRAARVNLASLAMEARDEQTAVALLEALVEQDPSAIGAREALAQYRLDQDAQDDAERLAKEVLARDPARPGAYCVLAQVYARRNKAGQTRLLVAQGLVLHPDAACLHLALGRVLLNEGDTSGGLATLERAVAADPQLLEARFLIAEALMSFKDFPRAVV
ncbi:MAG: tetratricopeptide repeat protein, partial [Myxococcota bacterium]